MHRVLRWAKRWQPTPRQQMAALLVFVVVSAVGMWRVEMTAHEVDDESRTRGIAISEAICEYAKADEAADQALWLDLLARAGRDSEEATRLIRESFEARPTPEVCQAPKDEDATAVTPP